ncbi:MAG TPA: lytic murein transglycosylase [Xanthobacteraceae bacterium]|nr:lytic murein transglycosylase [Xanthobacteraceae bacterium]
MKPLARLFSLIAVGFLYFLFIYPLGAADFSFQQWLQSLGPQAEQLGVSRSTFDAAVRGLVPDLSLPDLALPGRPEKPPPGQPEFVQTPEQYLKESSLARLAERGRTLAVQHRDTLARIEKQFGVPGNVLLAIWGRETDFGGERQGHDAIQVLATQAYTGQRKDFFRTEFLYALKMLQDGVPRARLRSSWGGAMGMTQFLPTEFYKFGADFDGDGKVDIWQSIPDALASAAKQLAGKGWQPHHAWAYEVRTPKGVDCTVAEPSRTAPLREWIARGYAPLARAAASADLGEPASLLMPEGSYGPAFLTLKNYYVIKEYNYSDLYVLFVGNLADRIAGGGGFVTPWRRNSQLRSSDVEQMQRRLAALGIYRDKIDGKAGMLTRAAIGRYQKASGLKLDCWPSAAVLDHMHKADGRK